MGQVPLFFAWGLVYGGENPYSFSFQMRGVIAFEKNSSMTPLPYPILQSSKVNTKKWGE